MAEKRVQTENDKKAQGIFPTLEEANNHKPDAEDYKVYRTRATKDVNIKAGDEFFTWSGGPNHGRRNFLAHVGLETEVAERAATVVRVVEVEKDTTKMTKDELTEYVKKLNAELKLRHTSTTAKKGAATASESLPLSEAG